MAVATRRNQLAVIRDHQAKLACPDSLLYCLGMKEILSEGSVINLHLLDGSSTGGGEYKGITAGAPIERKRPAIVLQLVGEDQSIEVPIDEIDWIDTLATPAPRSTTATTRNSPSPKPDQRYVYGAKLSQEEWHYLHPFLTTSARLPDDDPLAAKLHAFHTETQIAGVGLLDYTGPEAEPGFTLSADDWETVCKVAHGESYLTAEADLYNKIDELAQVSQ
jgi:hypothetical protein